MRLVDVPRTATLAWCPVSSAGLLATGTAAGALDASFETNARIEIFNIGAAATAQAPEPVVSVVVPSRVQRLAWTGRSTPCTARGAGLPEPDGA